jgi:excisionase family DNA binding protein
MRCATCGCPQSRWLRVCTVAQQFGCSERSVRRMISRGQVDAVRLGRQWRIDHGSLDDLVRQGSVRPTWPVQDADPWP